MIEQMREMFAGVGRELRAEAARERGMISEIRGELQEVVGFED